MHVVQAIVLTYEVAWCKYADGKAGLLNRIGRGQDVLSIQGEKEFGLPFQGSCWHVKVFAVDHGGIFLQRLAWRYGDNLPLYLSKVTVEPS